MNIKLTQQLQKERQHDLIFCKTLFLLKKQGFMFCGAITRGTMAELSLEKVFSLLGTQHIKGSDKELKTLCIRIGELVELNGEDWVQKSRQTLLDEWEYIVSQGIIR